MVSIQVFIKYHVPIIHLVLLYYRFHTTINGYVCSTARWDQTRPRFLKRSINLVFGYFQFLHIVVTQPINMKPSSLLPKIGYVVHCSLVISNCGKDGVKCFPKWVMEIVSLFKNWAQASQGCQLCQYLHIPILLLNIFSSVFFSQGVFFLFLFGGFIS